MKIVVQKYAVPPTSDSIQLVEEPNVSSSSLKDRQVAVQVQYSCLNYADILQSIGKYQVKLKTPFIPGSECSGIITKVGSGVSSLKPGDQVVVLTAQGQAWQSNLIVDEKTCIKIPKIVGISLQEAAAFLVAYSTSHVALSHERHGQLKSGQSVLVLGASGGVGLAAVQICKAMGASLVIAGCSSDEKCNIAKNEGGADVVFNYQTNPNFAETVLEATKGKGVDIIYDPMGGNEKFIKTVLKCIKWGGCYLVIGFAGNNAALSNNASAVEDATTKIPGNLLLVKNAKACGVYWGSYMMHEPKVIENSIKQLMYWYAEGKIKPFISKIFAARQVLEAFDYMLQRKATGRVLLDFTDKTGETKSKL